MDEDAGVISLPLAIGGILATGAVGYDSYQKMRGKKGILPDLSGAVKGVGDAYNKAKESIMRRPFGRHDVTTKTKSRDSKKKKKRIKSGGI